MAGKDKRREQQHQGSGTGAPNKKDDATNGATTAAMTTTFDHSRPGAGSVTTAASSTAGSHRSSLTDMSAGRSASCADDSPLTTMSSSPSKGIGSSSRMRQTSTSDPSVWSCVVCCQKVPSTSRRQLFGIGPCDHPVCAVCSTKMRVLCDQDECPICRQEITKVRLSTATTRTGTGQSSFSLFTLILFPPC